MHLQIKYGDRKNLLKGSVYFLCIKNITDISPLIHNQTLLEIKGFLRIKLSINRLFESSSRFFVKFSIIETLKNMTFYGEFLFF